MMHIHTEKVGNVWFGVAFEEEHVYGTSFASNEKNALDGLSEGVRSDVSKEPKKATDYSKNVIATLSDIYNGKDVTHNFTLSSKHLSKYAMKVIHTVCKVPVGYVTSYGAVAKAVGGGPRAVGQIMARNPFAPICPCHRVVSSNLTLGGYGGGLRLKLEFLKREKRGHLSRKEIPVDGGRLQVFPVELSIEKAEGKRKR